MNVRFTGQIGMVWSNILSRILSLGVAALDFWLLWSRVGAGTGTGRNSPSCGAVLILILLSIVLSLVWFADVLSDVGRERGEWCPAVLINGFGWAFLLLPIAIFCWIRLKAG